MTEEASWPPPPARSEDVPRPADGAARGAGTDDARPAAATVPPVAPVPPVHTPADADGGTPTGAPLVGAPAPTPGGTGWTPPPRPGLVPLRPLGFGALLGAPFQVIRRSPRTTLGTALLIQGLGSLLAVLLFAGIVALAIGRISQAEEADQDAVGTGAVVIIALSALLPIAVSVATGALVQGVVVQEVARGVVGERPGLRALLRRVRGRFGALLGWTVLLGFGTVLLTALAVAAGVPFFLVAAADGGGVALAGGVIAILLAGLAAGLIAAWVGTMLSLVPSAIVLEGLTVRRAVVRSWRLVRRSFWRTFGVLALMNLMIQAASQVLSLPISLLVPLSASLLSPLDPGAQVAASGIVGVASIGVGVLMGAVASVLVSATIGLLYIDRRMRTEGLDVELLRYVEEREAGRAPGDPYAPSRSSA